MTRRAPSAAATRPASTSAADQRLANRDGDRLLLANQNDEAFSPGDTRVEEVPLQHGVVLGHDRDHDGRVLRALALMDGHGIGRDQRVELAKAVGDRTAVEAGVEFADIGIDVVDITDVTVIDLLVVVVLDLHDLIARRESPIEALDLAIAGRIEGGL